MAYRFGTRAALRNSSTWNSARRRSISAFTAIARSLAGVKPFTGNFSGVGASRSRRSAFCCAAAAASRRIRSDSAGEGVGWIGVEDFEASLGLGELSPLGC